MDAKDFQNFPVGKLEVIGARNRTDRRSELAAWAEVMVKDENVNEFTFVASGFRAFMKPNTLKV